MTTQKSPLLITDTTFRDGHQSVLATRMRTQDILPLVARMDELGLYSMEVWGGATFDVCTRFLGEDPWERLKAIRQAAPRTKLQMLLRGQNLVGYRNYADDVVDAFVRNAAETGIDIFRVFDALNDPRNFEAAFRSIKKSGKHIQAAVSYSLTGRRLGGQVFNIHYFVDKARAFKELGADSLCVKDMAGLLHPEDTFELISALKEVGLPVQLHTHYTSGMASMVYLKAIEAGVDVIDCSLAPFALRTGQPAIEPMVAALHETRRDTGISLEKLIIIGQELEKVAPRYRDYLNDTRMSVIDTGVLKHQVPGGMLSNLVSQLREADALDRINEVYEELPRVRKDLGTCPLVTPTSQIVGIQAVQNVLFGRYKMISAQVKDYAYGLYGRPPLPMDPEVQKLALAGYPRGETPITCRPGDILDPELETASAEIGALATDEKDLLTYTLYPTTGLRFLQWKSGQVPMPPEVKQGKTLEDIEEEDRLLAQVKSGKLSGEAVVDLGASTTLRVALEDRAYEVRVLQVGDRPLPGAAAPLSQAMKAPTPGPAANATPAGTPVIAPMPGVVIRYEVAEGDLVRKGQSLLILEAMKMENTLMAPSDGVVKKVHYRAGDNVGKGDTLVTLGGAS